MSHIPSIQRRVELIIDIDEDGDRALFARYPNDIDEWLCGDEVNPRWCYSTYAAEIGMLCYGKARERIDLVIEREDGEQVHVYKPAGEKRWREVNYAGHTSHNWFLDLFLFRGMRYYLR